MTAGAKRSWDNLQTQYPDAVSKAGNGYIFDLTKLKPDAEAEALKNALSGSAGENALFEKAKAELGPDATASEVAQRAQEMKTGTPAPKTAPNLPKQYEKYGFERTENIPYDENTFGTPNQALQDAWKKQGWKEGDPYPGVQFMKLKNSARKSVMKEGQPIAKKEEKKKPFAAPEQNMEAANFKQRLNDKMTAALA
jgi:hypothetical protein